MKKNSQDPVPPDLRDGLYRKPTFMIRRAHQIASQLFVEACVEVGLTPSQYAILFALRHLGSVGQNELGRLVMLDRCTTSLVVRALLDRGLLIRTDHPDDRRKTLLSLNSAGRLLLSRAERMSGDAAQSLLSVFNEAQASSFLDLLQIFTDIHDERNVSTRSVR